MQAEILQAVAENLNLSLADIDRHNDLREDLGLGPIELNDLITYLAGRFSVTFDPEDVANLQTVEDLIVLIEDNSI